MFLSWIAIIFIVSTSNPVSSFTSLSVLDFTDTVDSVYKEFCYQLTQEEKIIYKKTLISNHKDDDVLEELSMTNRNTYFNLKQKCYIKVAMWFNLEVYKN